MTDQPADDVPEVLPFCDAWTRVRDRSEMEAQIAWWQALRDEHMAKRQSIAVRKCQEEIDLLKQGIDDDRL